MVNVNKRNFFLTSNSICVERERERERVITRKGVMA